jgi:hypothetical protein
VGGPLRLCQTRSHFSVGDAFRHTARNLYELLLIPATCGHHKRDTVRRVDQTGGGAALRRDERQGRGHAFRIGGDETFMLPKGREFVDPWSRGPHRRACSLDVLDVLAAARVGGVRRSCDGKRASHPTGRHLPDRIGQHGVPVAIAPVDGERDPFAQGGDQVAALPVDGLDPLK